MRAKYVNLFSDFGFKKIFGEEANKTLLIDFLNSILPNEAQIKDLTFKNTEQLSPVEKERKAVYDIYCQNESGEKFIVELQKSKQNFFKERTIYYSTFPITEQAVKGDWDYNLKAVYCIGILDFIFGDYTNEAEKKQVIHEIKLRNSDGKTFYDKLTYIYIEIPNFNKTESELVTRQDKWLYFIKNTEDFQSIPEIFRHEVVFLEALEKAQLSKLSYDDYVNYQLSLKPMRDWYAIMDTAKTDALKEGLQKGLEQGIEQGIEKGIEQGIEKGIEQGIEKGIVQGIEKGIEQGIEKGLIEGKIQAKLEMAKSLKDNGVPLEVIVKTSGLTIEEIQEL